MIKISHHRGMSPVLASFQKQEQPIGYVQADMLGDPSFAQSAISGDRQMQIKQGVSKLTLP